MSELRFLALLSVLPGLIGSAPAMAASDFDATAYAAAVAKAEAGDPNVDYLWLRKEASAQTSYSEVLWKDWRKADGLIDKDPTAALRLARERLTALWTDFMAHIVAQMALEKLGRTAEAQREQDIAGGLLHSIAGGHKGTSADDAYNAVSIAEEYRVLFILHWKSRGQSLVNRDGHVFDVFEVDDTTKDARRTAWFNIDAYFSKEFGQ